MPKSGFMVFSKEMRSRVKEANPDMKFGDIAKELGKMWKLLSEEEKREYNERAAKENESDYKENYSVDYKKKIRDFICFYTDFSAKSVESIVDYLNTLIPSECTAADCIKVVAEGTFPSNEVYHFRATICANLMLQHDVTSIPNQRILEDLKNMGINAQLTSI